jgi:hypothetical protein
VRRRRGAQTVVLEHDVRELLRRTLAAFRYTLEAHPCSSCRVDYEIVSEDAKRLGIEGVRDLEPSP